MRPLKLLVISHAALKGVNRTVYRILAERHRVPTHLVVPDRNDIGDGLFECDPFTNEPFSHSILKPQFSYLRFRRFRGLRKILADVRPSHVLIESDPSSLIVSEVMWLLRGTGIPTWAVTNENLDRNYGKEAIIALFKARPVDCLKNIVSHFFWFLTRRFVNRVLTISSDGTKVMEKLGYQGRVTQMPLGFDSRLFFPQPAEQVRRTRDRLGLKETTIAYFGRVTKAKGLDCLVEALGQLQHLKWQFLFDNFALASEDYLNEIRTLLKARGVADRVTEFNPSHSEVPMYMNAVDIVVLPSISLPNWIEQYGRVIPEAMACGKICVVSSSGTPKELVGDAGFVFPEGNSKALSEILAGLLKTKPDEMALLRQRTLKRAKLLSADRQAEVLWQLLDPQGEGEEIPARKAAVGG